MLTVTIHAQGREQLAFWLSNAGAVRILRGDPRWFDFDLALSSCDGRLVNRAEPLAWAQALQRAYASTSLTVTLAASDGPDSGAASGTEPSRARDGGRAPGRHHHERERKSSPGRMLGRALGATTVCLLAALAACLTFAAGSVAPSIARTDRLALATQGRSRLAADRGAATRPAPGAPAPHSPLANAAAQGMAELVGLSDSSSTVSWDPSTGLWGAHSSWNGAQSPAWWQSALAIWTLARYLQATHSTNPRYQRVLDQTFELGVSKPGTHMPVDFANQFMDDTGWWALAWLAAARYELTVRHDDADAARFLAVSEWDADYIARQPRRCGGIVWRLGTEPDTVANAEFIALTAQLSIMRRAPGIFHNPGRAAKWRNDARSALRWLQRSGLVDLRAGTLLDKLGGGCTPQNGALTYTEGEVADALVQLGAATGDSSYLGQARTFLDYTMSPQSGMISPGGVLQEACEARAGRCQGAGEFNTGSFKGIFVQAVVDYDQESGSSIYRRYLQAQAGAILHNSVFNGQGTRGRCESPQYCQFGFYWSTAADPSTAPVGVSLATQTSALDALTAALDA